MLLERAINLLVLLLRGLPRHMFGNNIAGIGGSTRSCGAVVVCVGQRLQPADLLSEGGFQPHLLEEEFIALLDKGAITPVSQETLGFYYRCFPCS